MTQGPQIQCSVMTYRGGTEWQVGGRFKRKGTCIYLWLIHDDVWQKSSQYCKVTVFQLKIKLKRNWIIKFSCLNILINFSLHLKEDTYSF